MCLHVCVCLCIYVCVLDKVVSLSGEELSCYHLIQYIIIIWVGSSNSFVLNMSFKCICVLECVCVYFICIYIYGFYIYETYMWLTCDLFVCVLSTCKLYMCVYDNKVSKRAELLRGNRSQFGNTTKQKHKHLPLFSLPQQLLDSFHLRHVTICPTCHHSS